MRALVFDQSSVSKGFHGQKEDGWIGTEGVSKLELRELWRWQLILEVGQSGDQALKYLHGGVLTESILVNLVCGLERGIRW